MEEIGPGKCEHFSFMELYIENMTHFEVSIIDEITRRRLKREWNVDDEIIVFFIAKSLFFAFVCNCSSMGS